MLKPTPKERVLFVRRLMPALLVLIGVFSLVFINFARSPQIATAATANTINFQARLQTNAGAIVPDGNYNIEFKIYDASSSSGSSQGSCSGDAHCLWAETRTSTNKVQVINGYMSVNLGSVTAFSGINWDQQLWMTMNIGGTGTPSWDGEMSPRLTLTAVPYAFAAGQLNTTSGSNRATLSIQAPTSGNQTFVIQDQGAAGTYNLLTNANGVQLQGSTPGTAQTGNLNISGTGVFGTAVSTSQLTASGQSILGGGSNQTQVIIKANSSQSASNPLLEFEDSGGGELARISVSSNGDFFWGWRSGVSLSGGSGSNFGMGNGSLTGVTTGGYNTGIGTNTLSTITTTSGNVAVGAAASENLTGNNNVAIGLGALQSAGASDSNIAIGRHAGDVTGSGANFYWNTFMGDLAGSSYGDSDGFVTVSSLHNAAAIGANAQVQANNTIVLGGIGTNKANVVIGSTMGTGTNAFGVSPVVYNTGTASQSGSTITGTGTSWSTANGVQVGQRFIFANGTDGGTISAINSTTSLTVSTSQTVSGQAYRIHNIGFQVDSSGNAYVASTNSTAFQVQNAGGTNVLAVNTSTAGVTVTGNITQSTGAISLTGNAASAIATTSGGITLQTTTNSGQTIGIGNNALAQTISIGNSTGATTVNVTAGSGGINLQSASTVSSNLTVTNAGSLYLQKATDYSTTGTSNDVNFGTASLVRLTGASAQTITGISGGADGRVLVIVNAGSNAATISNNSSSSTTAADHILTGTAADLTLNADASITLVYDAGASRWRIAGAAAGPAAGGTYISNSTTQQTSANFNIDGTGKAANFDATSGALGIGNSVATGVTVGNTSNTTSILLQGAASATYTIGTSGNTGGLTIGNSTASNTIAIGNAATGAGNTQTINIATGSTSTGKDVVTIGSENGASSTTLQSGTGSISLLTNGGSSSTTGTVVKSDTNNSTAAFQVQNASNAAVLTVNTSTAGVTIAGNVSQSSGTVSLTGNGASQISTSSSTLTLDASTTVNVGTTNATGVTLGNTSNSTAILLQGAASATYTIGTSANTGGITLGNSTASNTIAVGNAAATGTQTINIGTASTGGGKDTVTIGSENGASGTTLQSGTGNISLLTNGGSSSTTGTVVKSDTNNSTNAFAVQNASSVAAFTVDTTNNRVTIGTSDTTGTLLVLDTKTGFTSGAQVGDPTGVAGGMYYNSATGSFRCYQVDHWSDCLVSARTGYHKVFEMGDAGAGGSDDFIGYTLNGAFSQPNGETGHPGITQLNTSTSSSGYTYVGSETDAMLLLGNNDYWREESEIRLPSTFSALSSVNQRYNILTGFIRQQDTFSSGEPTDGCYFKYNDVTGANQPNGKWMGVCMSSSTSTTCDTGTTVAMDTWYRMTVVVNAAGNSADFRINGVSKCTVITNIPTGAGRVTGYGTSLQKTVGATDRDLDVDYIEIEGQFGTAR
jgi:fibronectin-binding autotransporter adhesin